MYSNLGEAIAWLRDNLNILKSSSEASTRGEMAGEMGECYFVPAFSGLYAPYWRKDARG